MNLVPQIAFPAHLVTPRLTTAEAQAEVLHNSTRGTSGRALVSHRIFDARAEGATTADWRVTFTYADGGVETR